MIRKLRTQIEFMLKDASFIFTLSFLIVFLFCEKVSSQTSNEVSDFESETIRPYEAEESGYLLPLDIAEETDETYTEAQNNPSPEASSTPSTSKDNSKPELESNLQDKTTALNVQDVEIGALIKTFSKLTKRNYIIDSGQVKGKVTVHLPSEITVGEALKVLDNILLLKGFTTVPVAENMYKVIPAKEAKQTTIPLVKEEGKISSDALVTQFVRLKYLPANDMQQLLQQFVSKDGMLQAVTTSNALIIIDSSSNIKRLRELVSQLDVPALDQEITIIPILYAEAGDIADKINEILGESGDKKDTQQKGTTSYFPPGMPFTPPGMQPRTPLGQTASTQTGDISGQRRTLPLKIIPDERINSLIVVADPETTVKVRALAEQLDSEIDRSGSRFWVYQLKHSDAETLADVINGLIGGSSGSSSGSSSNTKSSTSTSQNRSRSRFSNNVNSRNSYSGLDGYSRSQLRTPENTSGRSGSTTGSSTTSSGSSSSGSGRVNLEGDVTISPDSSTNSLIINAGRSDYQRIREVIELLDVKRRQVLVEATILEVTLDNEEGLGVEFQGTAATNNAGVMAQTNYSALTNVLRNPAALSDLTIAAASTGTLTLPGGIKIPSQAVILSALSKNNNVNVLSTPTILSTDNEEATIVVGENVPFVTSTSTNQTNLNNTFNQIERQDVGITLEITPQISSGDFVTLRIFVEISNVVPGTRNDPNGPTTTMRTSETQVEVKNGQMIITGGLIQDRLTDSTRGVPYLQDIPVLGQLFMRQDKANTRTNLLIFITPRIITDQFEARDETKKKANDLHNKIMEKGLQPQRDDVLLNKDMDAVVDNYEESMDGVPSTITPPRNTANGLIAEQTLDSQAATQRTLERFKALSPEKAEPVDGNKSENIQEQNEDSKQVSMNSIAQEVAIDEPSGDKPEDSKAALPQNDGDEETLSFRVSPSLPEQTQVASLGRSDKTERSKELNPQQTYVVFRLSNPADAAQISSAEADKDGTIGVVSLTGLSSSSSTFFEVGRRYEYEKDSVKAEFICIGVYGSIQEAATIHSSLRDKKYWWTLSPAEVLNLGRQFWKKG